MSGVGANDDDDATGRDIPDDRTPRHSLDHENHPTTTLSLLKLPVVELSEQPRKRGLAQKDVTAENKVEPEQTQHQLVEAEDTKLLEAAS